MKNYKLIAGVLFLLLIASMGFSVWRYTQAAGDEITICVKKNGLVHVIGEGFKRADCKKNESLLSWNMEGPQGPKGDKGDQGEQGTKGDAGLAGKNSSQLHLFDNNGQDLGILLGIGGGGFTTYLPSLDIYVLFGLNESIRDSNSLRVGTLGNLIYKTPNCTGPQFVENGDLNPLGLISDNTHTHFFRALYNTTQRILADEGTSRLTSSGCISLHGNYLFLTDIEEISLPFHEPLTLPIQIRPTDN
ncbi:MAG: collagen-like protein [bacterium]|nr:collagen-like protein [bacterium]MDZ4299813.1 collagen-like protein [Candidatus Sungbacteria bacterium]